MQIYVAGKNLERARRVMQILRDAGHDITYDWATNFREDNPKELAAAELEGVQKADALVYLWESDQESARYEAGMSMGLQKPIIISGKNKTDSFFFHLPMVRCCASDEEVAEELKNM